MHFDACDADFDVVLRIYTSDLSTELGLGEEGDCRGGRYVITRALDAGSYVLVVEGRDV